MVALIVHAGAWNIPDEETGAHLAGCRKAVERGWAALQQGCSALDAVQASIMVMEDDCALNAGCGAVLNENGDVELDASLMDGRNLDAGAVAGLRHVRNPIQLARCVLNSPHVLLVGAGAERFAQNAGLALCEPTALITAREQARWEAVRQGASTEPKTVFGRDTVGAVALDGHGNIAAGTSTGGSPNKHPGRVGDSPLIGCGTYADNRHGGVSTTGWGEAIIRVVLAKHTVDLLNGSCSAMEAACAAIDLLYHRVGGLGGLIVLDAAGRVGFAFNTPRMARAYMSAEQSEPVVAIEPTPGVF